jgi:hypothetical protein
MESDKVAVEKLKKSIEKLLAKPDGPKKAAKVIDFFLRKIRS